MTTWMLHLKSFFNYIEFEKRCSKHTLTAYKTDLYQFHDFVVEFYGDLPVEKISHREVRKWINHLDDQKIIARSINRKLASINAFFKYLNREEVIYFNPLEKIISLKTPSKLPTFVREESMELLLEEVPFGSDFEGSRDRLLIELLYGTGMRLSEIMNLRIRDVDISRGVVKVLGKRNKERLIPIHKRLIEMLKAYDEIRTIQVIGKDHPYLFTTVKGEPIYEKLIYRVVNRYLSIVTTLSKKSPHVLRHTFATVLLNKGAELNAIKELLGHSNLSATEIYTHNNFEAINLIYNQAHPRA